MNLRELFLNNEFVSKIGIGRFPISATEEVEETPHYKMQRVMEMADKIPMVASGVNQFIRFAIPKKISIKSSDEWTNNFLNSWLSLRPNLQEEIKLFAFAQRLCANSYFEASYTTGNNGSILLDNLVNINDPSRIYLNTFAKDDSEYWLYEVPYGISQIERKGKVYSPKNYRISYSYSNRLVRKTVYAVAFHRDEIFHLKTGMSYDGLYGKSTLMSGIDEGNVLIEMVKNDGITAKYRAMGKKVFSLGTAENPGTPQDVDDLDRDLFSLEKREHIITTKPIAWTDLNFVADNNPMDAQRDFLRKDLSTGLVPNFLTPWANPNSAATSEKANIPFELELQEFQQVLINALNRMIIGNLRKAYPKIAEDATFDFGVVSLQTTEEKVNYGKLLYDSNLITFNEFRKLAGYETVDNGDDYKRNIEGTSNQTQSFSFEYTPKNSKKLKEALKEQLDDKDKEWLKELKKREVLTNTDDVSIIKKNDIRGKILRLIRTNDKYMVFESVMQKNEFPLDMRNVALLYYEEVREDLEEQLNQFFDQETIEDKIMIDVFKQIKKLNAEVIDDLFQELPENKVKLEKLKEKIALGQNILPKLEDIFAKFNDRIGDIVRNATQKVLGVVLTPSTAMDSNIEVSSEIRKDLHNTAKIIEDRMAMQLKTFNNEAKNDIYRTVSNGVASQKPLSDIKQELKDKYASWKTKENPQDYRIDTIVRTELANASSLLNLQKWKQQGFTEVQWIAIIDDKTRIKHEQKNRRILKIDDILNGSQPRPGHWTENGTVIVGESVNCRCRLVPYN